MEKRRYPPHQILHSIPIISAGLSIALGLVVLLGWYTSNVTLIQIFPIFVPMQFNTALGFLVCGIGVLSQSFGRNRLAMACGLTAVVIGVLTLLQYIFNINLGIDQLLMKHYIMVKTSHPGRMAPNTALCFAITGAALLILSRVRRARPDLMVIGILGSITAALGVVSFFGYLSGVEPAYGWGNLTRMAVHTAAGFFALGMGIFAFAWFEGMPEDTWVPDWIAFPAGIGIATVILVEWQALNTKIGAEHSYLPVIVLIPGMLMTVLLVATIQLAQTSWRRAKDVERVNWKLENEIIERKQTEEALRGSEEKYHGMIQNLMEGFYSTTLEGKLLDYNTGFVKILGLDPNKGYAGIELPDFWQNPEDRKDYVEKFMRNGFIKNYMVNAKKSDGEKIVVQINSRLIKDEEGRPSRIEGTFLDITERKQAEDELNKYKEHLEELVKERTTELEEKNAELERMNEVFVGREFRIKELRNRVKELELKIDH